MTPSSWLLFPYLALVATLVRALAIKAHVAAPSCPRCGHPLERRRLGERICRCA